MSMMSPHKVLAVTVVMIWAMVSSSISVTPAPMSRDTPDIVINEVLYDPLGNDVEGEFIELFNNGSTTVDLQGWQLTDSDGEGVDAVLPSMVMPSGSFVLIMTGMGTNMTSLDQDVPIVYMGRTQGVWTNTGDDVLLMDPDGHAVDVMTYGSGIYVDPVPEEVDWEGECPEVKEGYSLIRYPDGFDTGSAEDFIEGRPTPGGQNSPDMPPTILDLGYSPEAPEAYTDVAVWADVKDDILLDKVWLSILEPDGTKVEVPMSLEEGLYRAIIEGRSGGTNILVTLLAQDNGGSISNSTAFELAFTEDLSPSLVLDLSIPNIPVIPGEEVKIAGQVHWSNGSMATGHVNVSIPKTMGHWTTRFEGIFTIWVEAPYLEGDYDLSILIDTGVEKETKDYELVVEWPHEGLTLELELSNRTVMTGEGFIVTGEALFTDGIPASGAKVLLNVQGSHVTGNCTTYDNGSFKALLHAPSLAGNYTLDATVKDLGREADAKAFIDVKDNIMISLHDYPDYLLGRGQSHVVAGRTWHHDGLPVMNSLVVVEVLNTTLKWRTYTDLEGNFSVDILAPEHSGFHILRITIVSGDALAVRTLIMQVRSEKVEGGLPGWDVTLAFLAMVSALVMVRRRDWP
jgi:hypothetical protein